MSGQGCFLIVYKQTPVDGIVSALVGSISQQYHLIFQGFSGHTQVLSLKIN